MARSAKVCRGLYRVSSVLGTLVPDRKIFEICERVGHRWRAGTLNPAVTVHLFLLQVLHGNTACSHLRHLSGLCFTSSAYCQARKRLPLAVFEQLLRHTAGRLGELAEQVQRWRGHRVFIVDGSSFSMPDTPSLRDEFGCPRAQADHCAFPFAHLFALYDMATGLLVRTVVSRGYTQDITKVTSAIGCLQPGDLLLGDRAYGNWICIAQALQQGINVVLRLSSSLQLPGERGAAWSRTKRTRRIHRNGKGDIVIEWKRPKARPPWLTAEQCAKLPAMLTVRIVQHTIRRKGFRPVSITLVTTLLDHCTYTTGDIGDLYGRRWEIETAFRHLKSAMGMRFMRCRTVDGVRKEAIMYAIAYNLTRLTMMNSADTQDADVLEISFVDGLRSLRSSVVIRHSRWTPLLVNRKRPGRFEPRRKKRRHDPTRYLTEPRQLARQRLMEQDVAA